MYLKYEKFTCEYSQIFRITVVEVLEFVSNHILKLFQCLLTSAFAFGEMGLNPLCS